MSSTPPMLVRGTSSPSSATSVIPSPPKVPPPRPPPGGPKTKASPSGGLFSRTGSPSKSSDVHPMPSSHSPPSTNSGSPTRSTMKKLISSFVGRASGGTGSSPQTACSPREQPSNQAYDVQPMSPLPTGSASKKAPSGPGNSAKIKPDSFDTDYYYGTMKQDQLTIDVAVRAPPKTAIPISLGTDFNEDEYDDNFGSPPTSSLAQLKLDVSSPSKTQSIPGRLPTPSPRMNISPFSSSKLPKVPPPSVVAAKPESEAKTMSGEIAAAAQRMVLAKQEKEGESSLSSRPIVTPMVASQKPFASSSSDTAPSTKTETGAPLTPNGLSRTASFELRNSYRTVSSEKKRSNEIVKVSQKGFDVDIASSRSSLENHNIHRFRDDDEETWTVIRAGKETVHIKSSGTGPYSEIDLDIEAQQHSSACSSRKTSDQSISLLSTGSSSATLLSSLGSSSHSLHHRTASNDSHGAFHSTKSGSLVSLYGAEDECKEQEDDRYLIHSVSWGLPPPPPSSSLKLRRATYSLEDFDFGVILGTGSFGRVRFARFRDPIPGTIEEDVRLAVKILKKECVKRLNQVEHIKHEKDILEALVVEEPRRSADAEEAWMPKSRTHPFIVQLFGTFQTQTCLFMVMEFIRGGEFFCHLRMRGHFKNHEATFYTASVASVFAFLHRQDVAYRDLKPENLMLDHEGYIKVVDFGFAKQIPDNKTYTLCGTPEYIAPEVLLNQGHGKGVDWWALGILTYEMLSGVAPFTDADPMSIYQKIVRGHVQYPVYFDPDARSFLKRLLQVDTHKRYGCLAAGARDVVEHRWLSSINFDLLLARKAEPPVVPFTASPDDTSCFEEYPDNAEVDLDGIDGDPYRGGGDFPDFDVVCL